MGKRVLLLEDLVTTGSSSLAGVEALREAGAVVTDCIVIVNYGFPESAANFTAAQVVLHPLVTFQDILAESIAAKVISTDQQHTVESWVQDPWGWRP